VDGTTYKLDELAKAAGTSPRTVRYYVQRGLIPPPSFRGKDSSYSREHLVRLQAIKKLQDAYLPLDAIAAELEGKSIEQIEAIVREERTPPEPVHHQHMVVVTPTPIPRAWRRVELAKGVELHVADDAPLSAKELAEKILNEVSSLQKGV